jgi:hypothetical protein
MRERVVSHYSTQTRIVGVSRHNTIMTQTMSEEDIQKYRDEYI